MSYISNTPEQRRQMLDSIGVSLESDLFTDIPEDKRLLTELKVPPRGSEPEVLATMKKLAEKNLALSDAACFLGGGAYDHFIPSVVPAMISRAEFLTSYTPYQAELSQGLLQSIYEYQSLICCLTGMDISNASIYDGATALVEAALMACRRRKREKIIVSATVHPEHSQVLKTYAHAQGLSVVEVPHENGRTNLAAMREAAAQDAACFVVQNPNFFGIVEETQGATAEAAHAAGAVFIVCVDPISLGILKPPGEYGADVVVGEGQGLGNNIAFGGPYLGFLAIRDRGLSRQERLLHFMPGRVAGLTTDSNGKPAYVLSLTAREQHVKRGKASSNICTNEALMALAATVYLAAMGKEGLRQVANLCAQKAHYAFELMTKKLGIKATFGNPPFFKEFAVDVSGNHSDISKKLLERNIIGGLTLSRFFPELKQSMLFCVTEKRTKEEIETLVSLL